MSCMKRARTILEKPPRAEIRRTGLTTNGSLSIKVYVDGSFSYRTQVVGCGGVLRTVNGDIVEAFMCGVPGHSSFAGELWGCIWGLRRAWDKGYRKVTLLCDATEIFDWIGNEEVDLHEDGQLIGVLNELVQRCWDVSVQLIRREDNEAADSLAKHALQSVYGFHYLSKELAQDLISHAGIT